MGGRKQRGGLVNCLINSLQLHSSAWWQGRGAGALPAPGGGGGMWPFGCPQLLHPAAAQTQTQYFVSLTQWECSGSSAGCCHPKCGLIGCSPRLEGSCICIPSSWVIGFVISSCLVTIFWEAGRVPCWKGPVFAFHSSWAIWFVISSHFVTVFCDAGEDNGLWPLGFADPLRTREPHSLSLPGPFLGSW